MIDTSTPNSPGWWLDRLMKELGSRQARYGKLDRYYRGDPDLPEGAQGQRAAYRAFQKKSRTNFAGLVVEAVRQRLSPVGFRTGADGDEGGDKDAWRIWQANNLDAGSMLVHRASLSMSDAYVIVAPSATGPVITPEDPRQVITAHDPANRRRVTAALKVFADDVAGADLAYLYLPGMVAKAKKTRSAGGELSFDPGGWEWMSLTPEALPAPVVPVVRFPNRADMFGGTLGEFEDSVDTLDRINHMLLQRLVIATVQAFKQRAISGVPSKDAQGNDIDYSGLFPADPGAMWLLPNDAKIWESTQADLGPLLQSVRHDVQDLAATTGTPLFYLTPDAANGSAEGASLAREGLVFKVADRIVEKSEPWEQVMSLAFLFSGDKARADLVDMEVLWAPPERFSLAERYDAASKAQAAGVPWRQVMENVLQFSPQETDRMEAARAADLLLSTPAPFPQQPPQPPMAPAEAAPAQ